jgi:hypothetical protein
MIPVEARDILLYYGGAIVLGLLIFMRVGRQRKGMRLRLRGRSSARVGAEDDNVVTLNGHQATPTDNLSHIQKPGERPLNVIFNFNGHSWDAYEVLGLPAGSSPENVEKAYREGIKNVDPSSRSFFEAAFHAIRAEWKVYKGGA